ncbi:MAG: hypothetical protein Q9218_004361 [Villophora microphyllina]
MAPSLDEWDTDSRQLLLFRRRYFQTEEPSDLTFPSPRFLKDPRLQQWVYETMFKEEEGAVLPHSRYKFRVLKQLMRILESAMEDPEEDEISDDLAGCLATMLVEGVPNEHNSAQEKKKITYTLPSIEMYPPVIHMWESPSVLAGDGETGLRTWQAALFLGTYLSTQGRHLVKGKSVIELAGGLGFVSILSAKHLGANKVLLTDGSETVVRLAERNVKLNQVEGSVEREVLQFGGLEVFDVLEDEQGGRNHYDLLLGADMLYDPNDFLALMLTLQVFFSYLPDLQFVLSVAVRAEDTLESFLHACSGYPFHVKLLDVPMVPKEEQLGFFHDTFHPIQIYSITKSDGKGEDSHSANKLLQHMDELALEELEQAYDFKRWSNKESPYDKDEAHSGIVVPSPKMDGAST